MTRGMTNAALLGALLVASCTGDDTRGTGPSVDGSGGGLVFDAGGVETVDPTTCAAATESKSYVGCDFWPTVTANLVWEVFDYAVVIANPQSHAVQVSASRGDTELASVEIPPGELGTMYLPWVPELKGPQADACGSSDASLSSTKVAGGAYHLVASHPVSVYQFNALQYRGAGGPPGKSWSGCPGLTTCADVGGPLGCYSFSNDASLLFPSTAFTGNYRVTGLPGVFLGAYVSITAVEDDTTVTLRLAPGAEVQAGPGVSSIPPGGTGTVTLRGGEVWQAVAVVGTDLSGSLVQADRPVQVLHGIPCVTVPSDVPAYDHIEESMVPAETLGHRYFVVPPTGPTGFPVAHLVRIYGNVDGTELGYPAGAPAGAPTTINAGQVVELGLDTRELEIAGNHEFAVSSFMVGGELADPGTPPGNRRGDPSQSLVTAVEQYRTRYAFLAPTDYDVSFVDIVQPLEATVSLDGEVLPFDPIPIGDTGYGTVRVQLGPGKLGAHELTANRPVGIHVAGYGAYTSYYFPGGLDLEAIAPAPPK